MRVCRGYLWNSWNLERRELSRDVNRNFATREFDASAYIRTYNTYAPRSFARSIGGKGCRWAATAVSAGRAETFSLSAEWRRMTDAEYDAVFARALSRRSGRRLAAAITLAIDGSSLFVWRGLYRAVLQCRRKLILSISPRCVAGNRARSRDSPRADRCAGAAYVGRRVSRHVCARRSSEYHDLPRYIARITRFRKKRKISFQTREIDFEISKERGIRWIEKIRLCKNI